MASISRYRYDSRLCRSYKHAKRVEACYRKIAKGEYNTIEKYGNGFVVTNRYDPRCNDKVTPVKPEYTNYGGNK